MYTTGVNNSQKGIEQKAKAEECAKANRIKLLRSIVKELQPEDRECFHRIRSALLAFHDRSYEGYKSDYNTIINYPPELLEKIHLFFSHLGLDDFFKANIAKVNGKTEDNE